MSIHSYIDTYFLLHLLFIIFLNIFFCNMDIFPCIIFNQMKDINILSSPPIITQINEINDFYLCLFSSSNLQTKDQLI